MALFNDLVGKTFGRLTVQKLGVKIATGKRGRLLNTWDCLCSCGARVCVRGSNLSTNPTQSCGCLSRETAAKKLLKHGHAAAHSPEYASWKNMWSRCTNNLHPMYKNYGGRGIKICDRWENFACFLEDMGFKPFKKATIERRDNSLGYCADNCEWIKHALQARNKRNNTLLTYRGETLCMAEWAERLKLRYAKIMRRLSAGWTVDRTLSTR